MNVHQEVLNVLFALFTTVVETQLLFSFKLQAHSLFAPLNTSNQAFIVYCESAAFSHRIAKAQQRSYFRQFRSPMRIHPFFSFFLRAKLSKLANFEYVQSLILKR